MSTISLAIQKGGSGKTTTAINLAAALQQMGKRVLLVDIDPQANLTHAAGLHDEPEPNIYHLLMEQARGMKVDLKKIKQKVNGLEIIPAGIELAGAELELVSAFGREHFLNGMLEPLKDQYDFIFIDCPPAIGMLTVNALVASDWVLCPLQAEALHLKGLKSFLSHYQRIKGMGLRGEILGLMLSRFSERKKLHRKMFKKLKKEYGGWLFKTTIRVNISLAEAQEKGVHIYDYNKTSNGAMDYLHLAQEFLEKIAKGHSKKKSDISLKQ